jgi:nuclear pore complex protein Nup98-Nup96
MTRFAAYSSGSSTEEEEEISREHVSQKRRSQAPADDVDDDDDYSSGSDEGETTSSSDSEPSEMLEGELINSPPRRPGRTKPKNPNALVEDENGEIQYAHEMDKRASPGSTSSRSSPGAKSNPGYHGDPTVIPWAQLVGVDAQKMHVMQASLFRTQDEAAALGVLNQAPKGKGPATRLEVDMKATTGRKHRRDSGGDALRYDSREVCMFNDSLLLWSQRYYSVLHLAMTLNLLPFDPPGSTHEWILNPLLSTEMKELTSTRVCRWVGRSG